MRTIRRLSAAFQLLDGCTKGPVLGASILVDGVQTRYVSKGDGTYVFSDLAPRAHTYQLSAPGYCPVTLTLPVIPPHFPEVVLMQHAPGGARLGQVSHFCLRLLVGEAPLGNTSFRVTLLTQVGVLRLVEPAGKGESTLALAGGYALGMLYQKYVYQDAPEETVLLTGYDKASGRYELQEPLAGPLKQGTLLRPVWDLTTDRDGSAILPAVGLFLQREEAEFSFACQGGERRLVTETSPSGLHIAVAF